MMSISTKEFSRVSSSFTRSTFLSRSLDTTPSSTPTLGHRLSRPSIDLLTNSNSNANAFIELLTRVREGLKYHLPELCEEGVNGTYFLKDKNGTTIAVFKPQDEEGNSDNNPKRKINNSDSIIPINKGILPGEAALREVAAHLIDTERFFGVPKTQLVKLTHIFGADNQLVTKIGSLQEFIENDGCSEEFGFRSFPVEEVHKIGLLDLLILNTDRHAGNILVKNSSQDKSKSASSSMKLIPIDHGFSLSDNLECSWFEWMNWPQSRIPFDDNTKSFVQRLTSDTSFERDVQTLQRELKIRPECIQTLRTMKTLLKKTIIDLNMTLYDIGNLVCNTSSNIKNSTSNASANSPPLSILEVLCEKARNITAKREAKLSLSNSIDESNSKIKVQDRETNQDNLFLEVLANLITTDSARLGYANPSPASSRRY